MPKNSILYIDDQYVNLFFFQEVFKGQYDVITASSGQEGLTVLEEHPDIQIVVTDMKMPEMDGLSFIAEARKRFGDKHYFVATGLDKDDKITQALKEGIITGYFSKPYNTSEIAEAIKKCL